MKDTVQARAVAPRPYSGPMPTPRAASTSGGSDARARTWTKGTKNPCAADYTTSDHKPVMVRRSTSRSRQRYRALATPFSRWLILECGSDAVLGVGQDGWLLRHGGCPLRPQFL